MRSARGHRRGGYAIVITLWVLVLLMVLGLNFLLSVRLGTAGTRNFKDDTEAFYAAEAGYQEALAYLLSDEEHGYDYIDAEGRFHTDEDRLTVVGARERNGFLVEIVIEDEESRINLNGINRSTLMRLLEYAAVPDDAVTEIVDALADWRDKDDLHHLNGAEDSYYRDFGYSAKDADLDTVGELMLIRGFEAGYLSGLEEAASEDAEATPALADLVTTWGSGKVNVNTASAEVLEILGVSQAIIDNIMAARAEGGSPLEQLPEGMRANGSTASGTLRIVVTARRVESPMAVRITSVVSRKMEQDGYVMQCDYWRDEAGDWEITLSEQDGAEGA